MQLDEQNRYKSGVQMLLPILGKQEMDTVEPIAYVSDALRSPLTAIKGYAETLLHHEQHLSQQERHEFLQIINEASDELAQTIDYLLEGAPTQRQKDVADRLKKYRQATEAWNKQQAEIEERLALLRARQQALQKVQTEYQQWQQALRKQKQLLREQQLVCQTQCEYLRAEKAVRQQWQEERRWRGYGNSW